MTMIFWWVVSGSKRLYALVKASSWLAPPSMVRLLTAVFRSAVFVRKPVCWVAVRAKLTMAIWLPPPILPS